MLLVVVVCRTQLLPMWCPLMYSSDTLSMLSPLLVLLPPLLLPLLLPRLLLLALHNVNVSLMSLPPQTSHKVPLPPPQQ